MGLRKSLLHALGSLNFSDNSVGKDSNEIAGISTDSRFIKEGFIFAAIPGEKFDGHDYVAEAAKKAALGAIVSKGDFPGRSTLPKNFLLIEVPNTTEALRKLASAYRSTLKIPIVAVAGSNGKTTTKEWVAHLLSKTEFYRGVYKTKKSLNSILGIALSILEIRNEEIAVIEIGIDEPGWMDQHLEVVRPTHGLITTIAEEHLNLLHTIEKVAEEELKLFEFLSQKSGFLIANLDSPWIANKVATLKGSEMITYGLDAEAQVEGRYIPPNRLQAFGVDWVSPLPGKHNAQNLLGAIAVLRALHPNILIQDLKKLSETCSDFKGEAHRSRWINLQGEIQVYDDSYNANPSSMESAFKAFFELSDGCIQHAVLGDMLDLGDASIDAHRRVLNLAIVLNFDTIFLFGPKFKKTFDSLVQRPKNIFCFDQIDNLIANLKPRLEKGNCIFLKGSRGMALERVLESLES